MKVLVTHLAIEYAMDNKSEFDFSDDYLASLIKKIKIKIFLSKYSVEEQIFKLGIEDKVNGKNSWLNSLIDELIDRIENNAVVMDIMEEIDHDDLRNTLRIYLLNSHQDIEEPSEDEKLKIINVVNLIFDFMFFPDFHVGL